MNIARFYNMDKLDLTVEFLTPTFLGGADQQGESRSPPFKNLLRQWWRIVNGHLPVDQLRRREGELFGTVLGENECCASAVRLVITPGQQFTVSCQNFHLGNTHHPEVGDAGMNVQNSLYLGFGPVTLRHGAMNFRQYISPGSTATLRLSFPRSHRDEIIRAVQYIDAFGAIGSRCRNGYGSLALTAQGLERLDPADISATQVYELVGNNVKEYPNRFGRDEKLLLWESVLQNQWTSAMTLLAGTYLRTRTHISIAGEGIQKRHALGYPVTHHSVGAWGGGNGRMPSQLRLMVKRDRNNGLVARILHLPHKLPKQWPTNLPSQLEVWEQVHHHLDNHENQFHRIGGVA